MLQEEKEEAMQSSSQHRAMEDTSKPTASSTYPPNANVNNSEIS